MPRISAQRRDARRQQILDAALALFSENGFHQTGMAEIVAATRLSRGAVYLYFSSKDEIIEALADDRHASEALINLAAAQETDALAALRSLVAAYARALVEPGAQARRRVSVHGWAEALRNEVGAEPERETTDVAEEIRQFKQALGGGLLQYGVGELTHTMLKAQLVDEVRLLVFPFTFGAGPRIFEHMGVNTLKLIATKTFSSGAVALHYEPQKSA